MMLTLIIIGTLAAIFVARENQRISEALSELVMFLVRPLGVVMSWVAQAIARLVAFIRAQLEEEGPPAPAQPTPQEAPPNQASAAAVAPVPPVHRHHLSRFIGALLLTALTVLFGAAELYLNKLRIEALLGLSRSSQSAPPASVDLLSAGAMLAVSLFWGLMLIDLYRGTHLFPSQFLGSMRKPLLILAWTCLGWSLATFAVLGVWGGLQVSQPVTASSASLPAAGGSLQTGGSGPGSDVLESPGVTTVPSNPLEQNEFDRFAAIFFGASLPMLVGISLAVSFCGVIYLMRYLGVGVLALLLVPLAVLLLPLRILEQVFLTVIGFCNRLLELIASLGRSILNTIGPPLKEVRNNLHRRVSRALSAGEAQNPTPKTQGGKDDAPANEPGHTPSSEPKGGGYVQPEDPQPEDLKDWNWGWTDKDEGKKQ
jgi:hypothetical protein